MKELSKFMLSKVKIPDKTNAEIIKVTGVTVKKGTYGIVDKVIVTNTVEVTERFKDIIWEKIQVLDVSELCACAIYRSLTGESISELMNL